MHKSALTTLFFLILITSYAQKIIDYPKSPKDSIVNIYHNTSVSDPYQWMENPDDHRLSEWIETQKKITGKVNKHKSQQWKLKEQLTSLHLNIGSIKSESYKEDKNQLKSKYEFVYKSDRIDRAPDLHYRLRGSNIYRTLLKSKDLQHNKEDKVRIARHYVNEKHDLVAVEVSHNGSDWRELYFFDLVTGKQLPDVLRHLRISSQIVWDEKNLYYDGYDEPKKGRHLLDKAEGQKLYYHRLNTPQTADLVLFQNPDITGTTHFDFFKLKDKMFFYHSFKQKDQTFRAISIANNNPEAFALQSFLFYPDNDSITMSVEQVLGDSVILKTNWNAPNGRVLLANVNDSNKVSELIPEYDALLSQVNQLGKDKIACIYRNDGYDIALIYKINGELLKKIKFPLGKKINNFYENNANAQHTDFSISSFFHPDLWFQISLKDLTYEPSATILVPYKPHSLETRYVKFKSKDGTLIPMYITCLKDTKLNGENPTLLTGYGGYGVTIEPSFDESTALWLLQGGILAIPNIRGGGTVEADWGKAGRRLKKQNGIDDFISAAEYLVNEKYTKPEKLAIKGGSHGGLLIGAAITQRPELFKVAIAEAGAFDMLRFEKYTVGSVSLNIDEFGSSSDSTDFFNLKSYSPLHNIKKGVKYPNLLLITGDHDDRVPPFHSYKFLATLQEKGDPASLFHLYTIPGAGHGGAITPKDWLNNLLYEYTFLFDQLDMNLKKRRF